MANSHKIIHVSLWVVQVILAAMFIMAGIMKVFQPIEELSKMLPWVSQAPVALVRFIGISELLGGFGLILPSLFRIRPLLTPYAALGLAIIMMLASIFHFSRGEFSMLGTTIFLLVLALFIAWGRIKKAPIEPEASQI
jgi:uncharacterized membrane protein YphA (DoxX/SURF4 family)